MPAMVASMVPLCGLRGKIAVEARCTASWQTVSEAGGGCQGLGRRRAICLPLDWAAG